MIVIVIILVVLSCLGVVGIVMRRRRRVKARFRAKEEQDVPSDPNLPGEGMSSNPLHRNVDRLASPAAVWARGQSYQPPQTDGETDSIASSDEGSDGYLAVSPEGTTGYSGPEHQNSYADVDDPDAPVYSGIAGSEAPAPYDEPNVDDSKGAAGVYDQPLSEGTDAAGYLVPSQSSNAEYAAFRGDREGENQYSSPKDAGDTGCVVYAEPKTPGPDGEYALVQALLGDLANAHYEVPVPTSPVRPVVFDGSGIEYAMFPGDGGGYADVEADYGELGLAADTVRYDLATDTTALYDLAADTGNYDITASDSTGQYDNIAETLETPARPSTETTKQQLPAEGGPVYAVASFANDGGEPSPTYALAQPGPLYALAQPGPLYELAQPFTCADDHAHSSRQGVPAELVYSTANAQESVSMGSPMAPNKSTASTVVTYDVASDSKLEPALSLPRSHGRKRNRPSAIVDSLASAGIYDQVDGVDPIELGPVPRTPSTPFSPGGTLAQRRGSSVSSLSLVSPTAFGPVQLPGSNNDVFQVVASADAPLKSPCTDFAETPGLPTPRILPSLEASGALGLAPPRWSPPMSSSGKRTTMLLASPDSESSRAGVKSTIV